MNDPLLQVLLGTVEEAPQFRPWLTLTLPGMLVSGQLISAKVYGALSLAFTKDGMPEEDMSQRWRRLAEASNAHQPFVHLQEARFFIGGAPLPPSGKGLIWRTPLGNVLGFSMGALRSSEWLQTLLPPVPPQGTY